MSQNEIARVGNVSISQDAFQSLLNMRARGAPERFTNTVAKEALLDELVRREAILARAKAAGFDQRPDIQESIKRLIAAKFQEEQMKPEKGAPPAVSPQEIEQYYQQHQNKYATPAKARGAILFLKISALADADRQTQITAKAQSLLAQAKAASPQEFAQLVAVNSEDQSTRYRAGDTGWITRDTKSWQLDPAVVDALFSLKNPGDFASLISTDKGVFMVKLLEAQPPGVRPLPEVKDGIVYTLRNQKEAERERDFFAKMEAGLDIRINHTLLESIQPPPPPETPVPSSPGPIAQLK